MKDINHFAAKSGKLVNLRELVLAGNPLREDMFKKGQGEQFKKCVFFVVWAFISIAKRASGTSREGSRRWSYLTPSQY